MCLLWRNVCLGLFLIFWFGCLFFWHWLVWAACIFWSCKEFACNAGAAGDGFSLWVGKILWRRTWQQTPVFLPENSLDRRAWRSTVHRVIKSWTQLKQLSIHACNPLSILSFPIIFFHSEACLFTLFIVSFAVQKLSSLIRSHLFLCLFPLF